MQEFTIPAAPVQTTPVPTMHAAPAPTTVLQVQLAVPQVTPVPTTLVALAHLLLVSLQQHAAQVTRQVLTTLVLQTLAVLVPIIVNLALVAQAQTIALQTHVALKHQITAPHGFGLLTLLSQ
jgi:hypothetical protein